MTNDKGITLLEVLIASAILAVAAAGFMEGFTVLARQAQHARGMLQAALLAEDMREEILSKPVSDPDQAPAFGREPGEYGNIRMYLDDRDDYSDLEDNPVTDLKGNPIPGMEKYSRSVRIRKVLEDAPTKDAGDKPSRMYLYSVWVKKGNTEAYHLEWLEGAI